MDTKEFFITYVFGWICADIEREIQWAQKGNPSGNALCALGLLAYTEFMATQLPPTRRPTRGSKQNFNAFFREMGPKYADLLDVRGIDVYKIFRCGLAHEYFVKGTCTIAMLNYTPGKIEVKGSIDKSKIPYLTDPSAFIPKPVDCGIGLAPNGCYYFVVEKYYEDFRKACENLLAELLEFHPLHPTPVSFQQMSDTG